MRNCFTAKMAAKRFGIEKRVDFAIAIMRSSHFKYL